MNVRLECGNWIINDEYLITEGVNGYEVYDYGVDEEEPNALFSSESFEECLTWIWNSI